MAPAEIVSIRPVGSQVYSVTLARVQGVKEPPRLTVSLRDHDWNGSCDCSMFTECCLPMLSQTVDKRWRCDHILAVRLWFMENLAPRMILERELHQIPSHKNANRRIIPFEIHEPLIESTL